MSYRQPARTAARHTRPTVYRVRRRRMPRGAVLAFLLAAASAFAATGQLGNGKPSTLSKDRPYVSMVGWPQRGQAALVLGNGPLAASPGQQPAPIASLAKVMTAYLTLERYPLSGAQYGFTITVSAAQAQAVARDAREGQSVVALRAGEQLSERQLLEALLIPSGNNIARMLATLVAGSERRFIAEMNAEARALGMDHTSYTDPSGFDPTTVSTAADQLRVFERAMRFAVFRQIVSMPSVTLPVTGTHTNYNPLIAEGYDGKTGSDSAAGGCLAFFTHVMVGGRPLTAVGVVMGQGHGSNTLVILAAAGQAAEQLVESAAPATDGSTIAPPGGGGSRGSRWPPPPPAATRSALPLAAMTERGRELQFVLAPLARAGSVHHARRDPVTPAASRSGSQRPPAGGGMASERGSGLGRADDIDGIRSASYCLRAHGHRSRAARIDRIAQSHRDDESHASARCASVMTAR